MHPDPNSVNCGRTQCDQKCDHTLGKLHLQIAILSHAGVWRCECGALLEHRGRRSDKPEAISAARLDMLIHQLIQRERKVVAKEILREIEKVTEWAKASFVR